MNTTGLHPEQTASLDRLAEDPSWGDPVNRAIAAIVADLRTSGVPDPVIYHAIHAGYDNAQMNIELAATIWLAALTALCAYTAKHGRH